MERVAAVIRSTGWSALRLSAYPPSAEIASSAGMAHSRPAEKARSTRRLPSSGAAAHRTSSLRTSGKGMRQHAIRLSLERDLAESVGLHGATRGQGKACAAAVGEGSARVAIRRRKPRSVRLRWLPRTPEISGRALPASSACVSRSKSPKRSARRSRVRERPEVRVSFRSSHMTAPKSASPAKNTEENQMVSRSEMER